MVLAQDEARSLAHNYIGTEHILLGLLREDEGVAARVLESLEVTVEEVRAQVARIVGMGDEVTTGQIPFTPRAKKVLELALREGLHLGHNYIGTEHILLGLARESEGVGARILSDFGVDADTIRNEVIHMLGGPAVFPQREEITAEPFEPESPPLAPEVVEEIERVRREKQAALEAKEFEQAAKLASRERRLVAAGRKLTRVWKGEPEPPRPRPSPRAVSSMTVRPARGGGRREVHGWQPQAVLVGWALFGVAAGIGLFVGWLIWG